MRNYFEPSYGNDLLQNLTLEAEQDSETGVYFSNENGRGRHIAICNDDQAALKALSGPLTTSKIVQKCRNRLDSISIFNTTPLWYLVV